MVIFHSYIGLPEGMYIVFPEFGRRLFFVFHVSYLSYRLKENMLDGENIVLGYAKQNPLTTPPWIISTGRRGKQLRS